MAHPTPAAATSTPMLIPLDSISVSVGPPSLYRRHRPRTFDEVVGQEHVVRTLRNAVEQGKVHHAYLFVGARGTGNTSMAKILAACLNCEQGPTTDVHLQWASYYDASDEAGQSRIYGGIHIAPDDPKPSP